MSFTVFSQRQEEFMNQKISESDFSEEGMGKVMANIYSFIGDDFDSLDIEILFKEEIIGTLLVKLAAKKDSLTYGNLYDELLEIKQVPSYGGVRTKQLAARELMQRPADYANWEADKPAFMKLGFEGKLLEDLRVYIMENSNSEVNYQNLLIGFRKQVEAQRIKESAEITARAKKMFEAQESFDEQKLLLQSKTENKPILLYFTGYSNIGCRKMEESTILDPQVAAGILNNFIFVPLYTDDKTALPEDEKKQVVLNGRSNELQTVGDRNIFYQVSRFSMATAPYFVVLNVENEVLGTGTYELNNPKEFISFLNSSLQRFFK